MDQISIDNLVVSGIHGATAKEHVKPQRFQVDLVIGYRQPQAAVTDNVADALDYRAVKKIVYEVIEGPRRNLLETLAEEIARRILLETTALSVVISIKKPDVWESGRPGVTISRS